MIEHIRNRKRFGWKNLMLLIGLAVSLCPHAGAAPGHTLSFGIQSGWSLGVKFVGSFQYHLGGHVQYDVSDRFSLQFSLSYQKGTYIYHNFDPSFNINVPYTVGSSFFSYSLNGVFHFPEWKNLRFYLLGGAGICKGKDWVFGTDSFFIFSGGAGAKICLDRKSGSALDLGWSFHHLFRPAAWRSGANNTDLIRLNVGVEIALNLQKKH
jgi:hypothetical protein